MFGYHAEIVTRYPGVRGGIVHVAGIDATTSTSSLRAGYVGEQEEVAARLGALAIADIPSIAHSVAAIDVTSQPVRSCIAEPPPYC